jgi:pimeloyl-ACP methyl ester carboxylesterase
LSSSYLGWGASSPKQDVIEISKCISYFRGIKTGKVVLMGHSTGCQDVMEYLTGEGHETRQPVDGGILQAPVSDREAQPFFGADDLLACITATAQQMVDAGEGEDILPSKVMKGTFAPAPVTARRWLSMASPNHDGEDDYFSSDLTDERLLTSFGALPARSPLLILVSGADEYVPRSVNKEALVKRWIEIAKRGEGMVDEEHSGVLEGASHNVSRNPEKVVDGLVKRVLGFLEGVVAQSHL